MQVASDSMVVKQVATESRNLKVEDRRVVSDESVGLVARQSPHNLADSRVPQFVHLFLERPA